MLFLHWHIDSIHSTQTPIWYRPPKTMFSRNVKDNKNGARLRKAGPGTPANSSTVQLTAQQTNLAREHDEQLQLQKRGERGLKSWHEIRKFVVSSYFG